MGCTIFDEYRFSNEEFSAKFLSKPNVKHESYDGKGGFLITFYESFKKKNSYYLFQSVVISRLPNDQCNLPSKEKIDGYLKLDERTTTINKLSTSWRLFELSDGTKKIAKYLDFEIFNEGDTQRTYHKEIYMEKDCNVYTIVVFGGDKEKVKNLFEQFSKSFVFVKNKK